jgi:hypothetical protein
MQIKLVKQDDEKGCSAACIAMILGKSYQEITERLYTNFARTGLSHKVAREFITDFGFQAITKEVWCFHTTELINLEMIKPFAPVHLLEIKVWPDHSTWHALVMDQKGKLFDPAGYDEEWVRTHLHYIHRITGFWKIDAKVGK